MTPPTHDHTTPTTNPTTPATAAAAVAVGDSTATRVESALAALDGAFLRLGPLPQTDDGWATYSATMARICARRAGWWRVLLADQRRTHALHPVHERAAQIAHHKAHDDARFWRETVADWQARADSEPTSDAAGALSNWREPGVTG